MIKKASILKDLGVKLETTHGNPVPSKDTDLPLSFAMVGLDKSHHFLKKIFKF